MTPIAYMYCLFVLSLGVLVIGVVTWVDGERKKHEYEELVRGDVDDRDAQPLVARQLSLPSQAVESDVSQQAAFDRFVAVDQSDTTPERRWRPHHAMTWTAEVIEWFGSLGARTAWYWYGRAAITPTISPLELSSVPTVAPSPLPLARRTLRPDWADVPPPVAVRFFS
jgi:hypothetical protein